MKERNSTNMCTHASLSLLLKHRKPKSNTGVTITYHSQSALWHILEFCGATFVKTAVCLFSMALLECSKKQKTITTVTIIVSWSQLAISFNEEAVALSYFEFHIHHGKNNPIPEVHHPSFLSAVQWPSQHTSSLFFEFL